MKCSECTMGDGEFRGSVCPACKITPVNFSAGCTLGKPRQVLTISNCPSKTARKADPISSPIPKAEKPAKVKQARAMTGTEREYARTYLVGTDARFEAYPLKMANGHTYTGDFAVYSGGAVIEIHECKGGWAFGSQQRSRLAFDQCRIEFPHIKFVWAKKTKNGWVIK